MSDSFVYAIFIDAPIDRIWAALTTAAFTRDYWAGRRIESDWQSGSPVRIYSDDTDEVEVAGEVLECRVNERLVYTWTSLKSGAPPARVSFDLQPMGASVRLTLTHDPLPEEGIARQGWAAILSSLKSYLELGRPLAATAMFRSNRARAANL